MKKSVNVDFSTFQIIKENAIHIWGGVSGLYIVDGHTPYDFNTPDDEENNDWETPNHVIILKYMGNNKTYYIECISIEMTRSWQQVDESWRRNNNTAYKVYAGVFEGTPPLKLTPVFAPHELNGLTNFLSEAQKWLHDNTDNFGKLGLCETFFF